MSSSLDEYNDTTTEAPTNNHDSDAPELVHEDELDSGDRLMSIQANDGTRYWLAERSQTTLELRSIDGPEGDSLPSGVVAGMVYEDLPAEVRLSLKVEGYRMSGRNSLMMDVMG